MHFKFQSADALASPLAAVLCKALGSNYRAKQVPATNSAPLLQNYRHFYENFSIYFKVMRETRLPGGEECQ